VTNQFSHPHVPNLHTKLSREVLHELAVIVIASQAGSDVVAVVQGASGDCLAWDRVGGSLNTQPLDKLDWDGWDDASFKLVFNAQHEWLAGPLGEWLLPSYSVAKRAASLVHTWAYKEDGRAHAGSDVLAYLPIADHASYEAELKALEAERRKGRPWADESPVVS